MDATEDMIAPELRPGERVVWQGRPAKAPRSFMAWYQTGFAALWIGLLVFLFFPAVLFAAFVGGPSDPDMPPVAGVFLMVFCLVLVVFVLVGLFMLRSGLRMLVGPSRERYALTTERGIIVSPHGRARVASLSPQTLRDVERTGTPEMGTLLFGPRGNWPFAGFQSLESRLDAFRNIADPKGVETLIFSTFKDATP